MEKPKVRFNKNSANLLEHSSSVNRSKPKVVVKSIVPVNLPITISKNRKCVLIKDLKNISDSINSEKDKEKHRTLRNNYESTNKLSVDEITSAVASTHISKESPKKNKVTDSHMVLQCENKKLESINTNANDKGNEYSIPTNCNYKSQMKSWNQQKDHPFNEDLQEENIHNTNFDVYKNLTCQASNDNDDIEVLKVVTSQINSFGVKKHSLKSENFFGEVRKQNKKYYFNSENVYNDGPNQDSIKKRNKSQEKLEVMPCARARACLINKEKTNKLSKIKKSTVLNIEEKKNDNIFIELNSPCKNSYKESKNKIILTKETRSTPTNLLSQPKYNSSLNVMKKLKEIKQEKLITDIKHLPESDRNFINGKVSAALDFAPYESVYKDLIDLSIDDNQLPTRLRSKDPEPRNKDIVPKLSDFFSPRYAEQYFTAINPAIPNPMYVETLSAFTISNKINIWKNFRDN